MLLPGRITEMIWVLQFCISIGRAVRNGLARLLSSGMSTFGDPLHILAVRSIIMIGFALMVDMSNIVHVVTLAHGMFLDCIYTVNLACTCNLFRVAIFSNWPRQCLGACLWCTDG